MLLRIKIGVSEHNIRVNICIQIIDTVLAQLILESSLALSTRVITAIPARIVRTIAVHIHVVVLSAIRGAVEEDDTVNVSAVTK